MIKSRIIVAFSTINNILALTGETSSAPQLKFDTCDISHIAVLICRAMIKGERHVSIETEGGNILDYV